MHDADLTRYDVSDEFDGDASASKPKPRLYDPDLLARRCNRFIDNGRCRRYQIHVEFTLQSLLHDLEMERTEETAPKTEAQCR